MLQSENQEVKETTRFDRWILTLADFLQDEKTNLLRLKALHAKGKVDWTFRDVDPKYNDLIDDQLYKVYQQSFSKEELAKHGLTHSREQFEALMYIDPMDLIELHQMDDHYLSAHGF